MSTKASLDLGTLTEHLHITVQAKAPGEAGNAITVAAIGDAASGKAQLDCGTKGSGAYDTVLQAKTAGTSGNDLVLSLAGDLGPYSIEGGVVDLPTLLTSVASNGTVLCGVYGTSVCVTSSDNGHTWTPQTIPTSNDWIKVIWDTINSQWVAFGRSNAEAISCLATSPNGVDWTSRLSGTASVPINFIDAAISTSEICAVTQYYAYRSTNGTAWTVYEIGEGAGGAATSICYGNGKFAATCGGSIMGSANGTSWTTLATNTNNYLKVGWMGTQFLLNIQGGEVGGISYAISTDGETWQDKTFPIESSPQGRASWSGNAAYVVAIVGDYTKILRSTNLSDWTALDTSLSMMSYLTDSTWLTNNTGFVFGLYAEHGIAAAYGASPLARIDTAGAPLYTIHYQDGVTTPANVDTLITETSSLDFEVKEAATLSAALVNATDNFSAEAFTGGGTSVGVTIDVSGTAHTIHYVSGESTDDDVIAAITAASSALIEVAP